MWIEMFSLGKLSFFASNPELEIAKYNKNLGDYWSNSSTVDSAPLQGSGSGNSSAGSDDKPGSDIPKVRNAVFREKKGKNLTEESL